MQNYLVCIKQMQRSAKSIRKSAFCFLLNGLLCLQIRGFTINAH